ncbi:MAG: hypothetical protein LUQ65_04200, partial [Candidatus Helarchaeota archaeon]|nr:hypothetical protein [Candidatus Helarchaeota archaeon]
HAKGIIIFSSGFSEQEVKGKSSKKKLSNTHGAAEHGLSGLIAWGCILPLLRFHSFLVYLLIQGK